jgi:O-antigen ligase
LILVSLVVTTSRGAVGVGLAMLLALALAWWPRWRAPLATSAAVIALTVAAIVVTGAGVLQKQLDNAAAQNVLSFRDSIWRMGLVGWERYPWFGVGKDNYGLITHEHVRAWRKEAGKDYDESAYVRFPHAHNLYVNTLVERGIIGFAALIAVMLASLVALLRYRPRPTDGDEAWLLWGAAASGWIVTAGVGLVNTTLHHEHGLLTALLLALWLSQLPPRRASS